MYTTATIDKLTNSTARLDTSNSSRGINPKDFAVLQICFNCYLLKLFKNIL